MKIVLGSSSKWRAGVLRRAGFAFDVVAPDIDERAIRDADPERLVLAIANAKADAVASKIDGPAVIIASDQIVLCDGHIREKPRDAQEAREFIACYAHHPMETVNAVVVLHSMTGKRVHGFDRCRVCYRPSVASIADYLIAKGEIFTCSGGWQCEDPEALKHMEHLDGTFDRVKGMPMDLVRALMQSVVQP